MANGSSLDRQPVCRSFFPACGIVSRLAISSPDHQRSFIILKLHTVSRYTHDPRLQPLQSARASSSAGGVEEFLLRRHRIDDGGAAAAAELRLLALRWRRGASASFRSLAGRKP